MTSDLCQSATQPLIMTRPEPDLPPMFVALPMVAWHENYLAELGGPQAVLPTNASHQYDRFLVKAFNAEDNTSAFLLLTKKELGSLSPRLAKAMFHFSKELRPWIDDRLRQRRYYIPLTSKHPLSTIYRHIHVFCVVDAGESFTGFMCLALG